MIIDDSAKAEIDTFSQVFNLPESEVQELIDTGIISQGQTLGEWNHSYLQHLRLHAASNGSVDDYMDMHHAAKKEAETVECNYQDKAVRRRYEAERQLEKKCLG